MAGAFQSDSFQSDSFQVDAGTSVTAADSISSVTEAPTRIVAYVRTVADSVSAISEAVTAGQAIARSVADALASLTEAPTRIWTAGRSVADSIATLAESPARIMVMARTASVTLSSITEAVVRVFSTSRTVADSLATLSEAVVRVKTLNRTLSDSISSITQSVSRAAMSVSRTVIETITSLADRITSFATPYVSGTAIYLNGVNIAKPDGDPVLFATARFMSAVNGVPGTCSFRARDDTGTANYVPGQPLLLVIDGQRVWTGFVSSVKRVYVFPALNVTDFGPTRFFDIEGVDLNILFARRIVFDQSDPANVTAPLYGHFTSDATAISALNDHWLDLSGDDLDTSTLVEHVAAINEDQDARAWEGSDQWGQAMTSIAALPAAIFYLDPYRREVYTDTDTPNAPFGLSDAPNGTTKRGYREMEILLDGTNLANDVMAWGAGYGSGAMVFDRDEDATSISEHGRWQLGQTTFGVWKQATIERITDSIINGSPEHHRGAKDDRTAVTVTTYEPGLLPAQKVNFESTVFGWSDVLPIRKMEVTFPAPDKPKYELTLSHEIDTPWSFFDPFSLGSLGLPKIPPIPPIVIPPIPGGCDCLITDAFDRVVSGSLGTATCGLPWTLRFNDPGNLFSVDGSEAIIAMDTIDPFSGGDDLQLAGIDIPRWIDDVVSGTVDFWIDTVSATLGAVFAPEFRSGDFNFQTFISSNAGIGKLQLTANGGAPASVVKNDWVASTWYTMRFLYDHANNIQAIKIWPRASTEPGSWDLTRSTASDTWRVVTPARFLITLSPYFHTGTTFKIANLDISTVNRCTESRFDNFDRTVSGGFGTSSSGYLYDSSPGAGSMGADGSAGYVNFSGGDTATAEIDADGPWRTATGFVMTTRVQATTLPPIGQKVVTEIGTFHDSFGLFDGVDLTLTTDNPVPPADSTLGLWHNGIQPDQLASPPTLIYFTGQTGWYNIKWEYRPPLTRVRLWHESDPEPTTWDIEVSDAVHNGDETFWSSFSHTGAGSTTTLLGYINFDYAGKPCYIGGPSPSPDTPAGPIFGPICEVAVRIDSTHYQLSRSVSPGTTTVYEGSPGYLLLPGIARDYQCSDASGILTFSDTVASGTRIYVCYTANGLPT